ncbi:Rv3235 family protein [Knoellia sp. CPCC 206450]|uniref:Rv3235 family protein n=1 Tax=Knoellia tibetensis TaxID=3404798 RepID=UPI003B4391DA
MTRATSSHLRPVAVHAPGHRPPAIPLVEAMQRSADALGHPRYIQDALAVDLAAASDEQVFGPQSTARADLPDPEPWAAQIAQAIVEVMSGLRPAAQVVRWTTPQVYAVVARRGALAARRRASGARDGSGGTTDDGSRRRLGRAVVRSVRVCEPADGVAECSVVVSEGARVRAMAVRLSGLDGRWRVEALQIG